MLVYVIPLNVVVAVAVLPSVDTAALTEAERLDSSAQTNVAVQAEASLDQFHAGAFAATQVTVQTFL